MSQRKLIYTKRFPRNDLDKCTVENDDIEYIFKKLPPTAEELLKDYEENTKYVLNKERDKKKGLFLTIIRNLCESYEIDVDVYEDYFGYVANLHLCMAMYSSTLKNLIVKALDFADCFDLFKANDEDETYDVLLSLTYHTHDRYYKGKLKNWF